jgi:hypothetical protein
MSHLPPISFVKSRENLQAICKSGKAINGYSLGVWKYEVFDRVLLQVWKDIKPQLQTSKPLNYIINLHIYPYVQRGFVYTEADISELIEILKKEYPGVDFTYKETNGYDQSILERTIIMDWS